MHKIILSIAYQNESIEQKNTDKNEIKLNEIK